MDKFSSELTVQEGGLSLTRLGYMLLIHRKLKLMLNLSYKSEWDLQLVTTSFVIYEPLLRCYSSTNTFAGA